MRAGVAGIVLAFVAAVAREASGQVLEAPGSEFQMDLDSPDSRACVTQPDGHLDAPGCDGLSAEVLELGRARAGTTAKAFVRRQALDYWVIVHEGGSNEGGCASQEAFARRSLGKLHFRWSCQEENVAGIRASVFEIDPDDDSLSVGYALRGASGLTVVTFVMTRGAPAALRERSRFDVETLRFKPAPVGPPPSADDAPASAVVWAAPAAAVVALGLLAFSIGRRRARARARVPRTFD